jgi:hypothetical protein
MFTEQITKIVIATKMAETLVLLHLWLAILLLLDGLPWCVDIVSCWTRIKIVVLFVVGEALGPTVSWEES